MSIGFSFEITEDGKIKIVNLNDIKKEPRQKGKSILQVQKNYCVIDIETTGLDPMFDDIIEISALRIRNNSITDTFSTLVQPNKYSEIDDSEISNCADFAIRDGKRVYYIDSFITDLTGITNKMLEDAPSFKDIASNFVNFIGDDILAGHNVNFDINFLYDNLQGFGIILKNDYIDSLRLSKRLLPEMKNHKLQTLAEYFKIDTDGSHRAEKDCMITYEVIKQLDNIILEKYGSHEEFYKSLKRHRVGESAMAKSISTDKIDFDKSHPCFGKEFVFTGKLERMQRKDAMQLVVDLGGKCGGNVTKHTNFLVLGNNDYCSLIKDGKSNKQKKAEEYKLKGFDIEILSESVFYDMIED